MPLDDNHHLFVCSPGQDSQVPQFSPPPCSRCWAHCVGAFAAGTKGRSGRPGKVQLHAAPRRLPLRPRRRSNALIGRQSRPNGACGIQSPHTAPLRSRVRVCVRGWVWCACESSRRFVDCTRWRDSALLRYWPIIGLPLARPSACVFIFVMHLFVHDCCTLQPI